MTASGDPYAALVLAGRRGPDDPLARTHGVPYRALVPVAGVAMLARVLGALEASPRVEAVTVSVDAPEALEQLEELRAALASGRLHTHRSLSSPSRSVRDFLASAGGGPVLVTTADHALLTPEMLAHFAREADAGDADVSVGVVSARCVRAAHPDSVRTYLPLRGESFTGANLFAFRGERAARAAEFWVRAEQYRKRPWRLVGTFGLATLALFAARRLDLDAAFERVSRAMGVRVRPVALPFAEAAIDVDRQSDLELAARLLEAREGG